MVELKNKNKPQQQQKQSDVRKEYLSKNKFYKCSFCKEIVSPLSSLCNLITVRSLITSIQIIWIQLYIYKNLERKNTNYLVVVGSKVIVLF